MSATTRQISDEEQLGQERNAEFERRLAELRAQASPPFAGKFFEAAVNIAAEIFRTPNELANYAIPYFITTDDYHGSSHTRVLKLLEKWKLTDKPQTVIAVMDYVAQKKDWSGTEFVNQYGELAKQYLPTSERRVVFDRLLQQRGDPIPSTKRISEQAEFWAKTVQEYVPQDKWSETYDNLKSSLLNAAKNQDSSQTVSIAKGRIELVAETLARFGAALPLDANRKADVLNDVITLLTTPEQFYPDKEITEDEFRIDASRKGIIVFEAKRDLVPSQLNPTDYDDVVACLDDPDNRGGLSDKIDTLKTCAEKCIPEGERVDRLVTDILYFGARSLDKTPHVHNLNTVIEKVQSGFEGLQLTDEHRFKYKQLIEAYALKMAAVGELSDNDIYVAFNQVAKTLTPDQVLAWTAEMTAQPFLNPDLQQNADVMPFVAFLKGQFEKAVGKPEARRIVATATMAAGHVAGKFVMMFEGAVLYDNQLKTHVDVKNEIAKLSSYPALRASNLASYDAIIAALAQKREVA